MTSPNLRIIPMNFDWEQKKILFQMPFLAKYKSLFGIWKIMISQYQNVCCVCKLL